MTNHLNINIKFLNNMNKKNYYDKQKDNQYKTKEEIFNSLNKDNDNKLTDYY